MAVREIIIGTRGSALALWQAEFTRQELEKAGVTSTLKIIKTRGDMIQHLSFDKIEGKGFFTKELEEALLVGEIDLAVHSMKDLPTTQPEGLCIAAVSYRENPADTVLVRTERLADGEDLRLRRGARVGTSSVRRKAQLADLRPDLELVDIRGNLPTRIEKLHTQDLDAIVLAQAGLNRLRPALDGITLVALHPREFVPAPAQGVLAYQTLAADKELRKLLLRIHHTQVAQCTNVERKVLQSMGGGCHLPLGVYCELDQMGYYHAWAAYSPDLTGQLRRAHHSSSTISDLARELLAQLQL